jgi:SAM-dependent methyltransferase
VELRGPEGQVDDSKSKKLSEVAGFCEVILRYLREFGPDEDPIRVLECSCGKSYLGLVLSEVVEEFEGRTISVTGVDFNPALIDKCREVAKAAGADNAEYVASRTLEFESSEDFDLVVSLHACDTATDEAIAKGIQIEAPLVLAVPCCQNQIRGQLKEQGGLPGISEFGPARYRMANLLTDCLRAQFLKAAGYFVEMDEIVSPRVTPKNLCVCARRLRNPHKKRRDESYIQLRDFFGVKPKIEQYCPGVLAEGVETFGN